MIHHSFITHAVIMRLVAVLFVLHIVCWTTVYYLAFKYGLIAYPYLFLSTAFGWDPARAVAAFLLPIIALLTGLVLYLRALLIKPRLKTRFQRSLWKGFNCCIVLTCFGLLGVSAISIYTNIYVHLVFAFALFIGGILIMLISTFFDISLNLPINLPIRVIRLVLTVTAIVSGICLGVFFYPKPFFGSIMEMVTTGSIISYFCTFAYKLERVDDPIISHIDRIGEKACRRRIV